MQLQPTGFNLDGFFSLIKGFFKYIFSVHFFAFMYILTTLLIIILITFILFLFVRMYELRQEAKKKTLAAATALSATDAPSETTGSKENATWQAIREHLLSNNDSDWKLAVIEADIYLDRILDDKGFHGDTTSDKLKQVTPDKLPSIQAAWEAHKIRNRIAHDGAAFILTMPEARRLLSYFEMVFKDLGVI